MVGKTVQPAILMNTDSWGYGHFVLDDDSVRIFEQNLAKISAKMDKTTISNQLLLMMQQLAYPATRIPVVLNQMMDEDN